MLNHDDRLAIDGLFERLAEVERTAPPRDEEAGDLIRQRIARQPAAPYYLAQTVLVQEHALKLAQERIEALERQVQSSRGGLFGGLFGGDPAPAPARREPQPQGQRGPWQRQDAGGGFLAGAAQTALGVTGGVLLGSAIAGMFGAGSAVAAEQPVDDASEGGDFGDGGDFGGDGGDFGGSDFDFGGDF